MDWIHPNTVLGITTMPIDGYFPSLSSSTSDLHTQIGRLMPTIAGNEFFNLELTSAITSYKWQSGHMKHATATSRFGQCFHLVPKLGGSAGPSRFAVAGEVHIPLWRL
jgi:hypothetical protein